MEILGLLVTIVSIIVGIVGILVIPHDSWPRPIRRLLIRFLKKAPPEIPELSTVGQQSRMDHAKRINRYMDLHPGHSDELGFRMSGDPYVPSVSFEQPLIDCICTLLSRSGWVYLILPSAESQPDIEGVGRTSLTVRLLGFRLPYTKLIGLNSKHLAKIGRIELRCPASETWKLIASDMLYLGVSNDRLSVVPIRSEKVNFIWDLTRHLFRSTDLTYTTGAHRWDPKKRQQLEDLFDQVSCEGLNNLYADLERAYPVDEILIVRREQVSQPGTSLLRTLSGRELLNELEESILLSSNKHGADFWDRPREGLKPAVRYLLDRVAAHELPRVRELIIRSTGSSVPGFIYDDAVQTINTESLEVPRTDKAELGSLLLGVDSYNSLLFSALSSAGKIKMLVTSGEKVFQDGAFWRSLANLTRPFQLDILMLDPDSNLAEELERTTYSDKPAGFLREEIRANTEAIRGVRTQLKKDSPVSIRCWLYQDRPNLRITLLGDRRAIIAHYFPGYRTGSDTVFFDLHGPRAHKFVEIIRQQYEQLKQAAHEVT